MHRIIFCYQHITITTAAATSPAVSLLSEIKMEKSVKNYLMKSHRNQSVWIAFGLQLIRLIFLHFFFVLH